MVGLGGAGEGGPTVKNMTAGGIAVQDFYLGIFGVNPKPTDFTSFDDGSPSLTTTLKGQRYIPSVSFGYTAGAPYRFTGVLASLTLGGYDNSKFVDNNITFTFAADNERDLIIWLPLEACQAFEAEFGLIYDNTIGLYLVNSSLHKALLTRNASVTSSLGVVTQGGNAVDIMLPYAAFDLAAHPPYRGLRNSTSYFALRRAANNTQYTLGRTFPPRSLSLRQLGDGQIQRAKKGS
ncbi:hypothetical protein LTR66_012840 [Elasticomyces elasticus]|nr:hypothetical protein LTR66_012840 [Elasticomyces elasticus]KAK5010124.1 hypothetical protein LTR28_011688 [Elasticomyces elasticus]